MSDVKKCQNILITGAGGYLAKSIRALLVHQKHHVTSLVRTLNPDLKSTEQVILCDLLDVDLLKEKLEGHHFDAIIHCASLQPRQTAGLSDYFFGNVVSLKNLLNTIQLFPSTKFITFSSAAVYGDVRFQKLNEETLPNPTNDYALTKLMSEYVLQMHAQSHLFSAYCLRLPSLHGNNQKGGLINTYFEAIINNLPLEIYSNGDLKRNIMSFDEVAEICGSILKLDIKPGFHLYQLGSANSLSMKDIARYIADKTRSQSPIHCINKAIPNMADWDFDLDKARAEIFFNPVSIQTSLDQYIAKEK